MSKSAHDEDKTRAEYDKRRGGSKLKRHNTAPSAMPSKFTDPLPLKATTMPSALLTAEIESASDMLGPSCSKCSEKKRETSSKGYCVVCGCHLCSRCLRRHQESHVIRKGADIPEIITIKKTPKNNREKCSYHHNDVVSYCRDHECLCCEECVKEGHVTCDRQSSEVMVAETDVESLKRNVLGSTTKQLNSLLQLEQKMNENKVLLKAEREKQIGLAKEFAKQLIDQIRELGKTCVTQIKQTIDDEIKNTDVRLRECHVYIEKIRDDIRLIDDPRFESRNVKIMNLKSVQLRTNSNYATARAALHGTKQVYKFEFRPNRQFHDIVHKENSIGKLALHVNETDIVTGIAIHSSKTEADTFEKTCVTAIEALEDGRILLADNTNQKLKLFDNSLRRMVDVISLTSSPRGLSKYGDSMCVVTLPNELSVHFFEIEQTLDESNAIKKGKRLNIGKECIDAVALGEEIILCCCEDDDDDTSIIHIDFNGTVLKRYKLDEIILKKPNYMCLSVDSTMLYVTDADMGIYCIEIAQNGENVWNCRNLTLKCPLGITVDRRGHIYSVDYHGDSIYRLSVGGKAERYNSNHLKTLIRRPQCISYSPSSDEFLIALDESYDIIRFRVIDF